MRTINTIYLLLIFFIVTSLLLVVFLIYPIFKNIKNGSGEILSYQKESALIDMEDKELNHFKKKYKEYESYFTKIDQLFIDSKNPVSFVTFLEDTAYDAGLKPDIDLVQSPKKGIATFSISLQGNFSDIVRFSEKLETGPYLIAIQNVSMKKLAAEADGDKEENTSSQVDTSFLIEVVTQ